MKQPHAGKDGTDLLRNSRCKGIAHACHAVWLPQPMVLHLLCAAESIQYSQRMVVSAVTPQRMLVGYGCCCQVVIGQLFVP
jgi:hypothetical protein